MNTAYVSLILVYPLGSYQVFVKFPRKMTNARQISEGHRLNIDLAIYNYASINSNQVTWFPSYDMFVRVGIKINYMRDHEISFKVVLHVSKIPLSLVLHNLKYCGTKEYSPWRTCSHFKNFYYTG